MAECAFCGRSGVKPSTEHAIPKWLRDTVRAGNGFTMHASHLAKPVPIPRFEITTRRVCHDCNTGWMHRIEDQTAPIVKGLMTGEINRIDEPLRWVLARWMTKTLLTMQLATAPRHKPEPFGQDSFASFYRSPTPATGLLLVVALHEGGVLRFETTRPPDGPAAGFILHFHNLVFAGLVAPVSHGFELPGSLDMFARLIWPIQRMIVGDDPTIARKWPPATHIDSKTIDWFYEFFRPVKP